MSERLENLGCGCAAVTERIKDLTARELRYLVAQLAVRYWAIDVLDTAIRKAKQCSHWEQADAAFERMQEASARRDWTKSDRHFRDYERHYKAAGALWDRSKPEPAP